MHEKDLRMIEEKMVVKRSHIEAVIQRRWHCRIDFVFKQNGIAHYHCSFCCRRECGPCSKPHERRHCPSVHDDLHVIARECNFINALFLIHFPLEPGDLVDFCGIECRGQCGSACGATD